MKQLILFNFDALTPIIFFALQPWQSDVVEILKQSSTKFGIAGKLKKAKIYTISMAVSMEKKVDSIFDAIKDIVPKF